MRITKISDVNRPDEPIKPSGPMHQIVKNPQILSAFGNVLSRGGIQWERSDERWTELLGKNKEKVYFTYYTGYVNASKLYRLDIYIYPDSEDNNIYNKAILDLHFIINNQDIVTWSFQADDVIRNTSFVPALASLMIRGLRTPHETKSDFEIQREEYRMTRRPSTEVKIIIAPRLPINKNKPINYEISYLLTDLQRGLSSPKKIVSNQNDLSFEDALPIMTQVINQFSMNHFVDDNSLISIPNGANKNTWDFAANTWIKPPEMVDGAWEVAELDDEEINEGEVLTLGSNLSNLKTAQDFGGYFTGNVPDYAVNMLGSASVDASQINSMFGKANKAIELVNKFDSSLLSNISFIFNFAKSGAYGVYLSELDRAIKTKALQKKLESSGYKVEPDKDGMLRAYPTQEDKDPQEIQNDIDRLYEDLEKQGGTAFGINMNAVLSAAKQDATQSGSSSPDIWEWMALLHLGGTIVHEAIHAKGSHSEGPSESAEDRFINWALPIINEEYRKSLKSQGKEEEYTPLIIGGGKRMANSSGWYKTAQQMAYYVPQSFIGRSTGSDLSGRHALSSPYDEGRAPWGMMMQQDQSIPIEKRLGRQYMSPLPKGLNQEHDSYEEQLRKYTKDDMILDPHATIEELLSEGYEEDRGYGTIEQLLNEMRVKPLMVTINKEASTKNIKTADKTLKLTPLMAEEIAVDFANPDEHYDDPNDPSILEEEQLYKKLSSNNFNFTDKELLMIGNTLIDISDKDLFILDAKAKRQLFDVELQLGMYEPITDEDARNSVRCGLGVKMKDYPKVNGTRYSFVCGWADKYNPTPRVFVPVKVLPINKELDKTTSSNRSFIKKATLFGWMNNLEISDGSTIPGLSDRVMAWDDRDECFSQEEDWIKQQPRYNPTYDVRGFYYRYIEPRFRPQLWDEMVNESPGVHPAKRFANKVESEVVEVFRILGIIKSKLSKKHIKSTRILLTEDVMPYVEKVFKTTDFDISLFDAGVAEDGESVFATWISLPEVKKEEIEKAELFLEGFSDEGEDIAEKLLGVHKQKKDAIKGIMKILKDICAEYSIRDLYVVGGYPRDLVLGSKLSFIEDLDFSCTHPSEAIKVGGLLAEKLGVQNVEIFHRTMTLSFYYRGIKLDFKGNFSPTEVQKCLKDKGIPTTPLNIDIYNRDFTINMMTYDVLTDKISDVTGLAKQDLENGLIRTFFDPDYVCRQNPIIILRALKFRIRYGFEIDPVLVIAMKKNAPLLLSGRYTDERLIIARDNVRKEGKKEAKELFKAFGLEKLEEV